MSRTLYRKVSVPATGNTRFAAQNPQYLVSARRFPARRSGASAKAAIFQGTWLASYDQSGNTIPSGVGARLTGIKKLRGTVAHRTRGLEKLGNPENGGKRRLTSAG